MLEDQEIRKAVAAIPQRSERQLDNEKLQASFVDVGLVPQLENRNNQIAFGRRGTGKTHVLKILESNIRKDPQAVALYVDARSLGSSAQFLDSTLAMRQRCTSLFRDLLGEINNTLLQYVVENQSDDTGYLLEKLAEFSAAATQPSAIEANVTVSQREKRSESESTGAAVEISATSKLAGTLSQNSSSESETMRAGSLLLDDKIIFPDINGALTAVLYKANVSLWIFLERVINLQRGF